MTTAASSSSSISWRVYDDEHKLSLVLTEAARACVSAGAANPSEFLLSYFAQVTRGDSVERLTCLPVLSPLNVDAPGGGSRAGAKKGVIAAEATEGLRVVVRLFTKTETEVTVMRMPFEATLDDASDVSETDRATQDAAVALPVLDGAVAFAAMMELLSGPLADCLQRLGVYAQSEWDAAVQHQCVRVLASGPPVGGGEAAPQVDLSSARGSRPGSTITTAVSAATAPDTDVTAEPAPVPCTAALPTTAQFALSLAACLAASRNVGAPLYRHIHRVAAGGESGAAAPVDLQDSGSLSLPQLLLPFLGAASGSTAPAAGCVYVHTLYLLPSPGATGVLSEALLRKLVEAYRVLRERYNDPPLRDDGAIVLECFENLSDAVQAVAEVLAAVGVALGEDVLCGVRLRPPVVSLGAAVTSAGDTAASVPAAGAPPSAPSGGKKGGAGGSKKVPSAGKQSSASVHDFTYALFGGDPDVTGQQIAQYLKQQVVECEGRLTFLQDTHHIADHAGITRLDRGLRSLACSTCASGEAAATAAVDATVVELLGTGTVSALAADCHALRNEANKDVVLAVHPQELQPLEAAVDLAVGLGTAYFCLGAPSLVGVCAALTHLHELQSTLHAKRCLDVRPPLAGSVAEEGGDIASSADEEEEEVIPEIKRKSDKKKKKAK